MSPTAKDLDVTNSNSSTPGARPASAGPQEDNSGKPQPVPLEVPVTVNGARTVEGSDKREPFSETTQTVLVFGNGAVIRLASSVAAGQLLFLTNDKTKKEVVCQVVKSKNVPERQWLRRAGIHRSQFRDFGACDFRESALLRSRGSCAGEQS